MIDEGDAAPEFTLPAVVGGDFEEVSLADFLGDDIVVLTFYPADFNPACDGETTDLDELDLFTMQKDVSILGISADSVYSHRAFAEKYDLHIPLLADVHGGAAANYGVVADSGTGHLVNRAVIVIGPGGEVQYTWQTEDLKRLPPVEQVREAVEDIGGSSTAEARYRVGHAHYVEGRRAFTKAMGSFEEMEWMMAQGDFTRAYEEFEEAADQFNTAVRFGEREESIKYFERAEEKAQALWQAAEWLAESASAYASGEGAEGDEMRSDAEAPLEEARDIHEPPNPDDFPPEEDPAELEDEEEESILPTEDEGPPASLEGDLASAPPEAEELAEEMDDTGDQQVEGSDDTVTADGTGDDGATESDEGEDEIDDEELEEIAAELEEQTKQAQAKQESESEPAEEGVVPDDPTAVGDDADDSDEIDDSGEADDTLDESASSAESVDPGQATVTPGATGENGNTKPATEPEEADETTAADGDPDAEDVDGELDEGDIELDLVDPTEGKDVEPDEPADVDPETTESEEDEDEDLGSGDHGVPDSL